MSDQTNHPMRPPAGHPKPNRVSEKQARLIAEFSGLQDWEARYKRLIERGKKLADMPAEFHTEQFKVKGCQSQVWLHASLSDGLVQIQADSDALIVKGLAAVLVETYSDATPQEILEASPTFLKELGFEGNLSPSRANGLYAMLKQILYYAAAFRALTQARS